MHGQDILISIFKETAPTIPGISIAGSGRFASALLLLNLLTTHRTNQEQKDVLSAEKFVFRIFLFFN